MKNVYFVGLSIGLFLLTNFTVEAQPKSNPQLTLIRAQKAALTAQRAHLVTNLASTRASLDTLKKTNPTSPGIAKIQETIHFFNNQIANIDKQMETLEAQDKTLSAQK